MKAVILAGGLRTRLSEETVLRPKPMVEIAGKPRSYMKLVQADSAHKVSSASP